MNVDERDFQAVARLWRELAEFPAAQSDAALAHCLRALAQLVGANNAFWVGAVLEFDAPKNDRLYGWRPRALGYLHFDQEHQERVGALMRELHGGSIDPMTAANVARSGTTRAFLRAELVDDRTWERSWMYQEVLRPLRIEDRLVGSHAVDGQRESYIGLDRAPTDTPFGDRERDVFALFLAGIPHFHRTLLRSHGLLDAHATLSPRARDVLQGVLTDKSEAQIAQDLGVTTATAHSYVAALLKTFGVKRRTGLMARWLG